MYGSNPGFGGGQSGRYLLMDTGMPEIILATWLYPGVLIITPQGVGDLEMPMLGDTQHRINMDTLRAIGGDTDCYSGLKNQLLSGACLRYGGCSLVVLI